MHPERYTDTFDEKNQKIERKIRLNITNNLTSYIAESRTSESTFNALMGDDLSDRNPPKSKNSKQLYTRRHGQQIQ